MPPVPTSPNRSFCVFMIFLFGECRCGVTNRFRYVIYMLVSVTFVPRQDENRLESLERTLEKFLVIFNCFGSRQCKRETAISECSLLLKDFTHEGRLLN